MLGGVAVLLLLFLGFVQQLLDITKAQQKKRVRTKEVQGCTAKELGPKRLKALTTRELLV